MGTIQPVSKSCNQIGSRFGSTMVPFQARPACIPSFRNIIFESIASLLYPPLILPKITFGGGGRWKDLKWDLRLNCVWFLPLNSSILFNPTHCTSRPIWGEPDLQNQGSCWQFTSSLGIFNPSKDSFVQPLPVEADNGLWMWFDWGSTILKMVHG